MQNSGVLGPQLECLSSSSRTRENARFIKIGFRADKTIVTTAVNKACRRLTKRKDFLKKEKSS
jgi:hypothetical protein